MHLLLILGLESFTEYQVSIAALTELGMGPYSPPVLVKTLENGELVVFTFQNFVSLNVSFEIISSTSLASYIVMFLYL